MSNPKPLGDLDLTKLTPRAGEVSAYEVCLGGIRIGRVAQHEEASYREIKGRTFRGSLRGYPRHWEATRTDFPPQKVGWRFRRRMEAVEALVKEATETK